MELILDKPHTHAGKPYKAGERIDVADHDAEWLINHRVAHVPTDAERDNLSSFGGVNDGAYNHE